eukprot:comp19875_c1_seq1/m.24025 comp19875_c1_seq1/g.24025  ORF comp19875_c1_seq1/g.24025 comp19875_c1_seq1/m.24025 type:complete len:377 (-) comp19875_c1_seq1:70-1200(-)
MEGSCPAVPPNLACPPAPLLARAPVFTHIFVLVLGLLLGLFGPTVYRSMGAGDPIYRHKNPKNMVKADYYVVPEGKPLSSYRAEDVTLRYNYDSQKLPSCGHVYCMRFSVDASTKQELTYQLSHRRSKLQLELRRTLMDTLGFKHFDLQAIMNSPRLYMLSPEQWRRLLMGDEEEGQPTKPFELGLDIGAGNGFITGAIQPLFAQPMVTTDVSNWIAWRQTYNGFRSLATENISGALLASKGLPESYDVLFALNVLDSCPEPGALLSEMVRLMKDDGYVVISFPLPYHSYSGRGFSLHGETWEEAANSAVRLIETFGLKVVRMTRAPYLCTGTYLYPLFALDAGVFVAKKSDWPEVVDRLKEAEKKLEEEREKTEL